MDNTSEAGRDVLAGWLEEFYGDGAMYRSADALISRLNEKGLAIRSDGDGFPGAFVLRRDEDETGVSGTGIVADGVEFTDGTVALRWRSAWPTSVVFHDKGIEAVQAVHGHGGKTVIVWE